jgi:hypothetical protein
MRFIQRVAVIAAMVIASAGIRASEPPQDREVSRVQAEFEKVRALVDAGALPRASLEQAREEVADAQDAAWLRRSLYSSDLTEDQTEEMIAAARRRLLRRRNELAKAEQLADAGVRSRLSLTEPLEDMDRARKELDAALSRARLIHEIAAMARAEVAVGDQVEPSAATLLPYGERYDGNGAFDRGDLAEVEIAFEVRFAQRLPISAHGQTAVHRALGFDHRNRVDVAVHPDQPEGVWLRQFLESNRIPYFAFRTSVPGRATAPHIHIGPLSGRLVKGG